MLKLEQTKVLELVPHLTDDHTIGLLITGSYARDEATRYSDIDVFKFVSTLPADVRERQRVDFFHGRLLSVSTTTVAAKLDEMKRPETAIWVVPGLRQARILSDTTGALTGLKHEAEAFEWRELQAAADSYAEKELAGLAEEVNKLLASLDLSGGSAMPYATLGLVLGLTRTVAVKLGVLIPTEDRYLSLVEKAVGRGSAWTHHHRTAYGIDGTSSLRDRMVAALCLYVETSRLIGSAADDALAEVIDGTVSAIIAGQLNSCDE